MAAYERNTMNEVAAHLGGHGGKTWFDRGSLRWMINNYNVKSMVDVGCGPGGQIAQAKGLGIEAIGIDGDHTVNPDVLIDFTEQTWDTDRTFDLAWSVEFLEHVAEEYMDNYMQIFKKCKYVICTASTWPGPLHVNCKSKEWWIDKFDEYGFTYSEHLYQEILRASTMDKKNNPETGPMTWLERTGMVYVNNEI